MAAIDTERVTLSHALGAHRAGAVASRMAALVVAATTVAACRSGDDPWRAAATVATVVEVNAVVVGIVDGDTIDVVLAATAGGSRQRVRLIGIDTPETKRPGEPVECFGPEATAFITALLPAGTPVRLERDVEGRDAYGRLLAYVRRGADGLFVNEAIVRSGHARLLSIEPNVAHRAVFAAATRDAQRAALGLWAACGR